MFALSSPLLSKSHSYFIHMLVFNAIFRLHFCYLVVDVLKCLCRNNPPTSLSCHFLIASSLLFPLVFEQIYYCKCPPHEPQCSLVWWMRVAFSHQWAEEHEGSSNPSAECALFLYSLSLLLYAACSRIHFNPVQYSIKTRLAIIALTFGCISSSSLAIIAVFKVIVATAALFVKTSEQGL